MQPLVVEAGEEVGCTMAMANSKLSCGEDIVRLEEISYCSVDDCLHHFGQNTQEQNWTVIGG